MTPPDLTPDADRAAPRACILVLPLASCPWADGLIAQLRSEDLETVEASSLADAQAAWGSGRCGALLLAGLRDGMLPALGGLLEAARRRVLAAVHSTETLHHEWNDVVDDIIVWPATASELRYRLFRLAGDDSAPPPAPDELDDLLTAAGLVGRSRAFQAAVRQLPHIVRCDATVLISGETGTGKDLVARAIHSLGNRRSGPFVAVNCAALPETLFENELFGHARGAYTTAASTQEGLAGRANGGTLFLDEINMLSHRSQAALLRFLQDGQFRPLGASAPRTSNVRILAATNADIETLVADGRFREDLFYRVNVLRITLPPLRQRPDDIPRLASHILEQLARRYGVEPPPLRRTTVSWLTARSWRGNVRELENWAQRHFVLGPSGAGDDIEPTGENAGTIAAAEPALPFRTARRRVIADFERRYLADLIQHAAGNVSAASRTAGTERRALGRLLRKHAIDPAHFRRPADS